MFNKPQLSLLVRDLDGVRRGVPKDDVENNRWMNRKSSASKMPVVVEAAAYKKKARPIMPLRVRIERVDQREVNEEGKLQCVVRRP